MPPPKIETIASLPPSGKMRRSLLYKIGAGVLLAGAVTCVVTGIVYGITGVIMGGVLLVAVASVTSYFAISEGRHRPSR